MTNKSEKTAELILTEESIKPYPEDPKIPYVRWDQALAAMEEFASQYKSIADSKELEKIRPILERLFKPAEYGSNGYLLTSEDKEELRSFFYPPDKFKNIRGEYDNTNRPLEQTISKS